MLQLATKFNNTWLHRFHCTCSCFERLRGNQMGSMMVRVHIKRDADFCSIRRKGGKSFHLQNTWKEKKMFNTTFETKEDDGDEVKCFRSKFFHSCRRPFCAALSEIFLTRYLPPSFQESNGQPFVIQDILFLKTGLWEKLILKPPAMIIQQWRHCGETTKNRMLTMSFSVSDPNTSIPTSSAIKRTV